MVIPVIDIFAGPGGLGEGFSSVFDLKGERVFKTVLSIEMDKYAHETLELRSFFRQFPKDNVPEAYYQFLRNQISRKKLFEDFPYQSEAAKKEAWCAKLGNDEESEPTEEVDYRIISALRGNKNWILLGGPPCQAYSVVGRSRRKEKVLDPSTDPRVELYKQYLRILALHNPSVFVMENVKGMLSANTLNKSIFGQVRKDLEDPVSAYRQEYGTNGKVLECPGYDIFSVTTAVNADDNLDNQDFIVKCEEYGIPQGRHRVILVGIRKGFNSKGFLLDVESKKVTVRDVIADLPRLRSGISKTNGDSTDNWINFIKKSPILPFYKKLDPEVAMIVSDTIKELKDYPHSTGSTFINDYGQSVGQLYKAEWFIDKKIQGVCNHDSRSHMLSDLYRYLFVAAYGQAKRKSPTLSDFPDELLPNHKNVQEGINDKKFADRFRVQLWDSPAKTITSHISKDGHYYIHPDPSQCRSLTVREAARIQTFPDNYFFCGPRTSQYIQVGNAVPPLLAYKIALKIRNIQHKLTETLFI
ncbi:MAG: DNA cytosine methyltransferase [Balneolales bacterium]|nr:DNA cytosine methyltransferase [Balneolales bacterium]